MGDIVSMPYRKLTPLCDDDGRELDPPEYPDYLGEEFNGECYFGDHCLEPLSILVDKNLDVTVSSVIHENITSVNVMEIEIAEEYCPLVWFLAKGTSLKQLRKEVKRYTEKLSESIERERIWRVYYTKTPKSLGLEDNPQLVEEVFGFGAACQLGEKILASAGYDRWEVYLADYADEVGLMYFYDGENWHGER